MKSGKMPESGDVVLVNLQFTNSSEIKKRPAVVLFEDFTNIVVAGITSNINMRGVPLSKKEGAIRDSVIKTNYIFTTTEKAVEKKLFRLNIEKKRILFKALVEKLGKLNS